MLYMITTRLTPQARAFVEPSGILGAVSDMYIRLIPTDLNWQPSREAASAAVAYVAGLFSGPGDAVEHVDYEFYDRITLIDAGENTSQITCSRCRSDISLDWLGDVVRENGGVSFEHLDMTVPCCGAVVGLDTLHYDWPVGFARFEVSAMNPTRAQYELDAQELADMASIVGHPVTQVLAHY
ncbi:hypothetical protein [Planotetraspora mira]|uniref:Uncharacterized protein n=1 Tax=Planotetraspora mira TaxID=58121 RepID=A0A8J3U643_9ACTN|nr:hypothetical protein [Planotetraspora mira]GII33375.1 hypothetical protein Pmi06nite_68170 [Planotetraspora mira]